MAGPLATLIAQVEACTTLRSSIGVMFAGIAAATAATSPQVAALLQAEADIIATGQPGSTPLADALTKGTSHLAVALDDTAIPHLQRFLALSRAKRSVQIAALQTLLDQLTAQDG